MSEKEYNEWFDKWIKELEAKGEVTTKIINGIKTHIFN